MAKYNKHPIRVNLRVGPRCHRRRCCEDDGGGSRTFSCIAVRPLLQRAALGSLEGVVRPPHRLFGSPAPRFGRRAILHKSPSIDPLDVWLRAALGSPDTHAHILTILYARNVG